MQCDFQCCVCKLILCVSFISVCILVHSYVRIFEHKSNEFLVCIYMYFIMYFEHLFNSQ